MSRRLRDVVSRAARSWLEQDSDSRNSFLLIASISTLVILAIGVIAYGYYQDRIAPGQDTVLKVAGHKFSYDELERRVTADVTGVSNMTSEQFANVISINLAGLEREELLRQIAKEKGLTISDAELETQMREDLNLSPEATREAFGNRLRRELLDTGIGLDEYKRIAATRAIEAKLRAQYGASIPAEGEQIDARLLQLGTQADAIAAKQRLDNGESLAGLASTISIHSSKSKAGEIGWVARGALPAKLEEVAFAQEVGAISDIVEADEGFFIIQVRSKEVRPIDEGGRDKIIEHSLSVDLTQTRDRVGSEILLTTGHIDRLTRTAQSVVAQGG